MRNEERHIDLFERYRRNGLSESELKDFEARLAYDAEFKIAFNEYKSVEEGIKKHFRNELKSRFQEVDREMDDIPKKSSARKLIVWTSTVAAAIVLGIFIFQHFTKPNHIELAQEYWPYEEGLPVKMSSKGRYDDAMNAFKLEEYSNAQTILENIDSDTSFYFRGVIAFTQDEFDSSANFLTKVDESSGYYHKARFRLGLIYLILNKKNEAVSIFNNQIEQNTEFEISSKEILKKLD